MQKTQRTDISVLGLGMMDHAPVPIWEGKTWLQTVADVRANPYSNNRRKGTPGKNHVSVGLRLGVKPITL